VPFLRPIKCFKRTTYRPHIYTYTSSKRKRQQQLQYRHTCIFTAVAANRARTHYTCIIYYNFLKNAIFSRVIFFLDIKKINNKNECHGNNDDYMDKITDYMTCVYYYNIYQENNNYCYNNVK